MLLFLIFVAVVAAAVVMFVQSRPGRTVDDEAAATPLAGDGGVADEEDPRPGGSI